MNELNKPSGPSLLACAAAFLILLAGMAACFLVAQPSEYSYGAFPVGPRPALPLDPPQFNWMAQRTEQFVIPSGAGSSWGPLSAWNGHYLRYDLQSSQPVDTAVLPDETYKRDSDHAWLLMLMRANGENNTSQPILIDAPVLCFSATSLQAHQLCDLEGLKTARIFIRDVRPAAPTINAVAAATVGMKSALERQTAENRVSLTFYAWLCVKNCEAQP
jgi:hypothetical protein